MARFQVQLVDVVLRIGGTAASSNRLKRHGPPQDGGGGFALFTIQAPDFHSTQSRNLNQER